MKLPINWFKDYIDIPSDPKVLMEKMTSIGHMQDGPPKEAGGDMVYDLEIRQNRSDCLSLIGLAREAGAVLNTSIKDPLEKTESLPEKKKNTQITIKDPSLCYRFNSVTIENIKVTPSPAWLKDKLAAYGIKSINIIVDITNFVMVELGQPLHAFDADSVKDRHLIIRSAQKGEKLTVLGGKEVTLTTDDLVIATSEKAIALAGVMGGEETGVKDSTKSIILEAATYNQASVRRTSIRHMIRTEASTRLEKFLHPHLTQLALQRAVELIVKHAGGKVVDHTDTYPTKPKDIEIELNINHLNTLGGVKLSMKQALGFLSRLSIPYHVKTDETVTINIPYWRTDLEQEADIIEEVLRIYGYDNIPATLPSLPPPIDIQSKEYDVEEQIRDLMIAAGHDEQITEPLTKENNPKLTPVLLQNSLNADQSMLRTTLKHNLKKALINQKKYRKTDIRLFEIGKIYFQQKDEYKERKTLGILSSYPGNNYADIKGVLETVFDRLGYEYNETIITIEKLEKELYYAELNIEALLSQKRVELNNALTTPPQLILQDISMFVALDTKVGEMINSIKEQSDLIYNVELGEPPQIKKDKKTVFLHISFSAEGKTLTGDDVEPERKKIIAFLEKNYNAQLR